YNCILNEIAPATGIDPPLCVTRDACFETLLPLHRLKHVAAGSRRIARRLRNAWNASSATRNDRVRISRGWNRRQAGPGAIRVDQRNRQGDAIRANVSLGCQHIVFRDREGFDRSVTASLTNSPESPVIVVPVAPWLGGAVLSGWPVSEIENAADWSSRAAASGDCLLYRPGVAGRKPLVRR